MFQKSRISAGSGDCGSGFHKFMKTHIMVFKGDNSESHGVITRFRV